MSRAYSNLYTKNQLRILLDNWQCSEPIPCKGKEVMIVWPGKAGFEIDMAVVEWTDLKGTYGDRLYKTTMSSKAGRLIDESIQESHVIAFFFFQSEKRRKATMERFLATPTE